jgi:hypothetical protein
MRGGLAEEEGFASVDAAAGGISYSAIPPALTPIRTLTRERPTRMRGGLAEEEGFASVDAAAGGISYSAIPPALT